MGFWIVAEEHITYGEKGRYQLSLKRMKHDKILMYFLAEFSDFMIGTFIRPKWGIYRSLMDREKLRDETVYFSDIMIKKL